MTKSAEHILQENKLKRTNVRLSVLEIFLNHEEALSHQDIEHQFDQIDRITLYRTLRTFEEKGIIHKALDGSEKQKYALCTEECSEHDHQDEHPHFYCFKCDRTLCLSEVNLPAIELPPGYQLQQAHVVLQGICEECSREQNAVARTN